MGQSAAGNLAALIRVCGERASGILIVEHLLVRFTDLLVIVSLFLRENCLLAISRENGEQIAQGLL